MIAFAAIGAIGLLVLILSVLFGELMEALDVADAGVGSTAISSGLTGFGAVGVLLTANNASVWVAIAAAFAVGIAAAALVQQIITRLADSDTSVGTHEVIGLEGTLTAATDASVGEVRIDDPREVEARPAWSATALSAGTRVRVIARTGSRVKVERA